MSAVKGVNKTLIDAGGIASQLAKGLYDARVKCMIDTYEAAALATGSTISMCGKLPAGARIVEIALGLDATLNANNDFSVGDSASAARYGNVVGSGAIINQRLETVDGMDYVVGTASGDNQVVISTTGLSAATGTIKLAVFYTQD